MTAIDPALLSLAASQGGCFTTVQARTQCGTGWYLLERWVKEGLLDHLTRGLYAVSELREKDPIPAHRQFCQGALLLYPDGVLSGVSAIVAHDLPTWNVDLTRPILRRDAQKGTGAAGIRIRRAARACVETELGPAVPVARALVEVALDNGAVQGVVSADAALHRELLSSDDLAAEVAEVANWPRSHRAKAMLELVDGAAESPGESRTRCVLAAGGIRLIPQVTIRDERGGFVARVDFMVEGTKVIVEFDGRVKYAGDDGQALFEEKKREDRLRALGYAVVRLTWGDLERPGFAIAKVRRCLRGAA